MNKSNSTKTGPSKVQPKADKHNQSEERGRREIDTDQHSEETGSQPKEFNKKDIRSSGGRSR